MRERPTPTNGDQNFRTLFGRVYRIFKTFNAGLLVIIALSFVLGWQFGRRDYLIKWSNFKPNITVNNQLPSDENVDVDFKLFWQTWDLISTRYIDKKAIDPQKLYYGAISGMVAAVGDPYTVFLPPQAQKSSKEQLGGLFEGVGIRLELNKDKRLVVTEALKGTPAERGGVRAGDYIVSIDGKDTANISLPEAVNLIRGPKGSAVLLALFTENDQKPRDVKLTRDMIVVKSAEFTEKATKSGKKVAYLHVSQFGERTKEEWDKAVSEALSIAPQGIILDVRSDPGGYLDASVYIASEFIEDGMIVTQEDAWGNRADLKVTRSGKLLKLPLIVLINKGSASASEILAGALQDHKRGILVGEQSFGKGTIQEPTDLPQGTGLHITTAKWLTPNARWIHNTGLTPDIKVETGTEPGKDPQLDKALELLN